MYASESNHGPPQPDNPPTPIPPHPPLIMESRMIVNTIPKKIRIPTILRIVTPTLPSLFANMARQPITLPSCSIYTQHWSTWQNLRLQRDFKVRVWYPSLKIPLPRNGKRSWRLPSVGMVENQFERMTGVLRNGVLAMRAGNCMT